MEDNKNQACFQKQVWLINSDIIYVFFSLYQEIYIKFN